MTTPPPYSHQFSVPPNPHAAAAITLDMLPPIPPRPREVTAGLWGTALGMLVCLVGGAWDTIVKLGAMRPGPGSEDDLVVALDSLVHSILISGVAGVLCYFIWKGSRTALLLGVVGAASAVLRFLVAAVWSVIASIREGSPVFENRFMGDPYDVAFTVAGAIAIPVLLAFLQPASMRWSRKTGAIRMVRKLIEKGRPVRQLPPAIHD